MIYTSDDCANVVVIGFFFFWNRSWNDFLMWQCHYFWIKAGMNELETIDTEHIEFLMNQWCSSSAVSSFVIYLLFSSYGILNSICESHFLQMRKNLHPFVFINFKMYQNPFCSKKSIVSFQMNQFSILLKKKFLIHVEISVNLEKQKKKTMKHYLIKCFKTWFDKTNCCIDENYMTKNTIMKTIWWIKQSTPWSKLYIWKILF